MASNSEKKEKPKVYEVSPKWILIYQSVNLIVGIVTAVWSFACQNPMPLMIFFFFHTLALEGQFLNYCSTTLNISSTFYHPDLLSDKEFLKLKRKYQKATNLRHSYRRRISTKYQEIYDTLKPIIDAQSELRAKCWFTWLIGVPVKDYTVVPKRDNNDEKSIVETAVELDSDISTDNYSGESDSSDTDSSDTDSSADTDASDITDNKWHKSVKYSKSKTAKVSHASPPHFAAKKALKDVKKAFEDKDANQTEASMNVFNVDKNGKKNENEILKLQFAQMKAENAKLKDSVEKLIASQTIV